MRILIDVTHPSDVHLFRHFTSIMLSKGHEILFTARNKEVTYKLLDKFGIHYIPLGKHYKGLVKKILGLFVYDFRLWGVLRQYKPDLVLSHGSFYVSQVAWLLRIPAVTTEDTGNLEQIRLYQYFVQAILTPNSFALDLGKRHIRFRGCKEIAYLHPKYFQPDRNIFSELGLQEGQRYILLRFVSWDATHDLKHPGISIEWKKKIITTLEPYAKVFISSEANMSDPFFAKYMIPTQPDRIHDVMAHAQLLFGESATMASECAVLGTPAFFINNAKISYTIEQEQEFDLVYNYDESEDSILKALVKAVELLQDSNLKDKWLIKRDKYLASTFNLTDYLVDFIIAHYDTVK